MADSISEDGHQFSIEQLRSLEVAERSMSCLSLAGSLFIMSTFLIWPTFRKPINRLVFLASIGNLLCNVATLISVSGTFYGDSPLCRFQAFLIQMFIPADSLWTFCMALNVYLTFFKNYNSSDLRGLEKWYFLFCYGVPLLPALIFLIVDSATNGTDIYGPATLWCWIAVDWDWMRIAFFYGPVWIIIAITTSIYLVTGKDIFKQRAALRAFSKDQPPAPLPVPENPFISEGVTKVTEIQVTTETIRSPSMEEQAKSAASEDEARSSFSSTRKLSNMPPTNSNTQNHSRFARMGNQTWPYDGTDSVDQHNATLKSNFSTTVSAGRPPHRMEEESGVGRSNANGPRRNTAAMHANTAAWGYAKVSMLMFVALFIVWVPSTINRVYSLARPDNPSFGLSFLAGLVLPLQGFWNAMIYISTSWRQCKDAFCETVAQGRRSEKNRHPGFVRRVGSPFHNRPNDSSESSKNLSSATSMALDPDFYDISPVSRQDYRRTPQDSDEIELSRPMK